MKDDLAYIDHILRSIRKILEYTKNSGKKAFEEDTLLQDAVIRNIEIIGEATKKISSELKNNYPNIPWREMSGMRDKLIHDYLGVDIEIVWETIQTDIPRLQQLLSPLV